MTDDETAVIVATLFTRWKSSLIRYAVQACLPPDVAEDLVQDVFVVLHQTLRAGTAIEHPKAWVHSVLRRAIGRKLKHDARQDVLDVTEHLYDPHEAMLNSILLRSSRRLLSNREKQVLMLRLDEWKYREIADQLGISMKTVDTLICRALGKLRRPLIVRIAPVHSTSGALPILPNKSDSSLSTGGQKSKPFVRNITC